MRLYRAKRKDNGEWVYGWYIEKEDSHYHTYSVIVCGPHFEVDPATVGQSTGHVINKRELYEGDKVKKGNMTGYIRYRCDPVSMEFEIKTLTGDAWYDYMGPTWSIDELEIIGNIHSEAKE